MLKESLSPLLPPSAVSTPAITLADADIAFSLTYVAVSSHFDVEIRFKVITAGVFTVRLKSRYLLPSPLKLTLGPAPRKCCGLIEVFACDCQFVVIALELMF